MPSIFHGLLLLWMNYPPFMMHIRCIIPYAVKLDFFFFYGAVAFHPPLFLSRPIEEQINLKVLLYETESLAHYYLHLFDGYCTFFFSIDICLADNVH